MKSTGIVRKIDGFGRLVMPIEIRNRLDIAEGDSIEFFTEGETVVLRKYTPSCLFCGSTEKTLLFEGKLICAECAQKIARQI